MQNRTAGGYLYHSPGCFTKIFSTLASGSHAIVLRIRQFEHDMVMCTALWSGVEYLSLELKGIVILDQNKASKGNPNLVKMESGVSKMDAESMCLRGIASGNRVATSRRVNIRVWPSVYDGLMEPPKSMAALVKGLSTTGILTMGTGVVRPLAVVRWQMSQVRTYSFASLHPRPVEFCQNLVKGYPNPHMSR